MRKSLLFASFAAAALAAGAPHAALADGGCDLTPQIAELAAVQSNTSMDELSSLNAEVLARREVLDAAIDCDRVEIGARVEAFGQMPDNIKTIGAYREILEDLAEAYKYYEAKKAELQGLGIRDLRILSREMGVWRKTTYLPIVTWSDNFLIWADNQQFLEKASERLTQVSRVAFSLKLVNQDEINILFEKAKSNFDVALAENDKARNSLNQKRPVIALGHTQASLKALADTYQIFFALQEALEKIVK